ncbi:LysR family transcriptional regulator, partial [Thioclava sp. BHET1]
MELRHIRYFLAVAEMRNFTRAAEKMGIGQPPLSQQIRALEEEIGAQLFHRIPQGAELTEAGRAFEAAVRLIPEEVAAAARAARRAARGETGALRVGFTGSAPFNPIVTAAIRAFKGAYPDVNLSLDEMNTASLIAGLSEGRLDAGFLRSERLEVEGLSLRPLSQEPLLAVLPASHPQAEGPEVALGALHDLPLILTPRGVGQTLYDTILETCHAAGLAPALGQLAPQLSSVVNLVAAGLGFSLVPASLSQLHVTGVRYLPLQGQRPLAKLGIAYRRGS